MHAERRTDGRTNSLIQCHSKGPLLYGIHFAGNNKTYLCLHVKSPIFVPIFIQIWVFWTGVHLSSLNIKFYDNPFFANRPDTCGQSDVTNVIDTFHEYANVIGAFH